MRMGNYCYIASAWQCARHAARVPMGAGEGRGHVMSPCTQLVLSCHVVSGFCWPLGQGEQELWRHLSCVATQANRENSHQPPQPPPSFMLDVLPVATLPIYPGLGPVQDSADFCPVTFGSPVALFDGVSVTLKIIITVKIDGSIICLLLINNMLILYDREQIQFIV